MLASIITLIILSAKVAADECNQLCGYIAPTTFAINNGMCPYTGYTGNVNYQINWSGGSFSVHSSTFVVEIAVGSCCSDFTFYEYSSGIVTDGKYTGLTIIESRLYHSDSQQCNECQTNSGLSRTTSSRLLTIGTKGVGQWIECTGNGTSLYSPTITSTSQQLTYVTVMVDYSALSRVES